MRSRRSRSAHRSRFRRVLHLDSFDSPEPEVSPRRSWSSVPVRWVKLIVGLHLLPVAWIWTHTFFVLFSRETLRHGLWRSEEFWFFFLGADIAVLAFFGLRHPIAFPGLRRPWLVIAYVFGHELTHAIWVWLMGGHVGEFQVNRYGGYITSNNQNFWISLAPYFYPIYSVAAVIIYALAALCTDVTPYIRWLFLALGFTWSLHVCFTLWMIPKGQTDITDHGRIFSFAIIWLMNLATITGLLLLTAPGVTFIGFAQRFAENAMIFGHQVETTYRWVMAHCGE